MFVLLITLISEILSGLCRWYQATKSNNQAMAARVDSLKDEMDEALNKVEICKVGLVLRFQPGASLLGGDGMLWTGRTKEAL